MSIDITGIGALAGAAKGIADKFWPDKTELEKAAIAAELQITLGQLEINKAEATSTNWWVAGWRPYVGWVCGTGFAYQFLFMPLINGALNAIWHITPFIGIDTAALMTALGGLLGLGGLRTYEKLTGAEAKR